MFRLLFVHTVDAGLRPKTADNRQEGYKESRRRPKCQLLFRMAPSLILPGKGSLEFQQIQTTLVDLLEPLSPDQNQQASQQLLWPC